MPQKNNSLDHLTALEKATKRADKSFRAAKASGVDLMVQVLGPGLGQCKAADKIAGILYDPSSPPALPLKGCTRWCCGCCHSPVVID